MNIEDIVFIGLNSRVAALDRESGELVWQWQCPKPRGAKFVSLLVDSDRLIVSVDGYSYCLDSLTGQQLWHNPLKGFRTGFASIATVNSHMPHELVAAIRRHQEEQQAAAAHGVIG